MPNYEGMWNVGPSANTARTSGGVSARPRPSGIASESTWNRQPPINPSLTDSIFNIVSPIESGAGQAAAHLMGMTPESKEFTRQVPRSIIRMFAGPGSDDAIFGKPQASPVTAQQTQAAQMFPRQSSDPSPSNGGAAGHVQDVANRFRMSQRMAGMLGEDGPKPTTIYDDAEGHGARLLNMFNSAWNGNTQAGDAMRARNRQIADMKAFSATANLLAPKRDTSLDYVNYVRGRHGDAIPVAGLPFTMANNEALNGMRFGLTNNLARNNMSSRLAGEEAAQLGQQFNQRFDADQRNKAIAAGLEYINGAVNSGDMKSADVARQYVWKLMSDPTNPYANSPRAQMNWANQTLASQ